MSPPTGRVVMAARDTLAAVGDEEAGVVITDPPWKLQGGGKFSDCTDYPLVAIDEIIATLRDARRALVPGGHLYLFAPSGEPLDDIMARMRVDGWRFLRQLAWDKDSGRGLGAWRNVWEPVLIYANGKSRGFQERCRYPSLIRAKPPVNGRTAKPPRVYELALRMSSLQGELGVDPYCGTNPGEEAARIVGGRRWLAGDILTEEAVARNVAGVSAEDDDPQARLEVGT